MRYYRSLSPYEKNDEEYIWYRIAKDYKVFRLI